mgnify:FL=1
MEKLISKIGLEIHLELQTKTKLFCSCKNDPEETEPNKNICEICTGQPGVLPVLNKQAVIYAFSLAKALKMKINYRSEFARKNYFYPDLPKNYQISQYELPLGENGIFYLVRKNLEKKIRIKRIHLEEDTGKNLHFGNYSLVDFNRSGVPLIEIVTEPDFRSAEEVEVFAEELILLIRHLGISSANAEKGQIRFEANISLAPGESLGVKVEIKNINKIRSLVEAVQYEIERQRELILKGKKIIQETRGYDENKKITFSQRWKEEAKDYRYFPEPDLPPLIIDEEIEKKVLYAETPGEIKMRLKKEYNLDYKFSQILVSEKERVYFFEETLSELKKFLEDPELSLKLLINFFINDFIGLLEKYNLKIKKENITSHEFAHLLYLYSQKKISSKIVKEALELAVKGEMKVEEVVKEKEMISDIEILNKIIEEVIKEFSQSVEDYLRGEEKALEFLIGQVMKKTKGRAEPNLTRQIILEKINYDKQK